MKFRKPEIVHERRILVMALIAGLPAVITSMIILWWLGDAGTVEGQHYTPKVQWTLSVLILGVWLGFCFALRERVASPLRTLANLLEAMREGDYSIRARGGKSDDKRSAWIRVAAMLPGDTAIPPIGREVLVAFEEGDPDRPIIVGSARSPSFPPGP